MLKCLVNWGPFYEIKNFESLTMPKKLKGGTLWDFSTFILLENILKMEVNDPLVKKFRKKSHGAENTLREYPLAPLSFLDDVKTLLRKVSKNCKKSGPFRVRL